MKKRKSFLFYIPFKLIPRVAILKKKIGVAIGLLLVIFEIHQPLTGHENRYVFTRLNVNNGLSQNQINCIYRDSKGFVWFGTNAGLNRFDGTSFEVFSTENTVNGSIVNNYISAIAEDKAGNLWIATANGVSILNCQTYKFTDFDYRATTTYNCVDILYVNAMASDQAGNIWIGTNNGCFFYDFSQKLVSHLLIDTTNCGSPSNGINSIVQDNSGDIWMSTKNGFIIKYNPLTKTKEKFLIPDKSDRLTNSVTRMFIDKDNDLWVGNLYGLFLFRTEKGSWDNNLICQFNETEGLKRIGAISQNTDGQIWVAADGGGAFVIDKKSMNITNIRHQPFDDQKLSSNGLSYVHCDHDGIVWFGTTKKGVCYYKRNVNKFRIYKNSANNSNSLTNNDVNAIVEDRKGNIWIGTDGGGVNYLDRKTQQITRMEQKYLSPNSLSSNIIVSLFNDHANNLWIGTYFGGLNKYEPSTGKFTIYKHNAEEVTSISDDRIYGICEDHKNNLWIGTLGTGLNRLDPETGKFSWFNSQNSSICFDFINSVYRDKKNLIWASTTNGLASFDDSSGTFKCFYNQANNKSTLTDNFVVNSFDDSRGFLWICTRNGLNLMDRSNNTFRHFTTTDGLPSNSVHGIVEDKNGNLWLSSKNGISKLTLKNIQGIHQFDFSFTNYSITDGLQGKEFNQLAALCASDGEIFFGGPDGLNAFYPDEIKEDTTVGKMIFTDFKIFNKSVPYGHDYDNRILLEKPIFNTDKISLKYHENSFTIEFIALNYFFPEKNVYSYKLEGFDNSWIKSEGNKNSATYTNLTNGTYIFRVKEIKGNSTGKEISLKIVVLPPFWKSWIAYIIYAILIFLILIFLRRLILITERINMRIEHERLEAQHIHEIDTLKIKFFTNISHEFRTPLTLIMAPVEKLLAELKEKPEAKYLKLIEQNARRLLLMVNQLLDFRKLEVQGFNYNPSLGDIVAFLAETVSSFNNLSEQKHIQLVFRTKIKELNTFFDKDKLEKIMFNLLSNAFKFTPGYGKVSVTLKIKALNNDPFNSEKNMLVIKVEDTGIGIPEDKIEKIFTRFFQVDSTGQVEKGTGIGLSLVAEFVKLHEGEIFVTSEIGKGSCFKVLLPIINSGIPPGSAIEVETELYQKQYVVAEKNEIPTAPERPVLLIAEDNDDLRFYLKDNLLQKYQIYEASNGEEALRIITGTVIDLIISDIMMPVMDGIELCRRVKSDRTICHIPLILLTARSSEQQQLEGLSTGADDYITKPFNFQLLEAKISNIINLRRNARQLFKSKIRIEAKDITVTSLDEQFMHKAFELVEKNMAVTDYSVEAMSKDMGMSRTLLYKKILALTGRPPLEFVRTLRLKRAALLLTKSQLNVSEIAFQVGFNDPKYFSKHFKNEFGVLPSKYFGNGDSPNNPVN